MNFAMKKGRGVPAAHLLTPAFLLLLQWTAGSAFAHQPNPVDVAMETRLSLSSSSYLHLTNNTRDSQTITFLPGPLGDTQVRPQKIVLGGGSVMDIDIGNLGVGPGIHVLHIITWIATGAAESSVVGPAVHEILSVEPGGGIRKLSYAEAFLSRRRVLTGDSVPERTDIGGGYFDAQRRASRFFVATDASPDAVIETIDEVTTYELSAMRRKQLPSFSNPVEVDGLAAPVPAEAADAVAKGGARDSGLPEAGFGTIHGKFSVKLATNKFQAAWAWKVRAWQQINSSWYQRGSATVKGDGTWTLSLNSSTVAGAAVQLEYQPANRFVQIQDADGDVYTWVQQVQLTGASTNAFSKFADLSKTGEAPGIDILFQGAMALWRKFNKHGMNPLRDEPIEVTYPNTMSTGMCQSTPPGGNTIAWSCSYSDDGRIWMIQQHASIGVIQHEISHSIHSFYWDGDMPSGSGGYHNITKCHNPGIALSEGFADFMPYWVQFDRTASNPTEASIGLKIDKGVTATSHCPGQSNEAHVAATFWDAYDTTGDGTAPINDSWNFYHSYAVVSTFLANPGRNSMPEYVLVYQTLLGPNYFFPVIATFALNYMY